MVSPFVPHNIEAPLRGQANGPLSGLTGVLKDMYAIAGERAGGGSPEWLKHAAPAQEHSGVVKKLLAAGADITGKTISDEFFYSITGANAHYGTPTNPKAPNRLPGGSSGGSASAIAAGTCDFAIGSDTGGSVRIPAAFCGLYGIRPTHGRIDLTGVMAMAPSFDVPGWFASSPGVFRKIGEVLLNEPEFICAYSRPCCLGRRDRAGRSCTCCPAPVAAFCHGQTLSTIAAFPLRGRSARSLERSLSRHSSQRNLGNLRFFHRSAPAAAGAWHKRTHGIRGFGIRPRCGAGEKRKE